MMKYNRFGRPGIAILGSRTCPTCGTMFDVDSQQPNKKFCSRRCNGVREGTRIIKPCKECGKEFKSERIKKREFCSKKCSCTHRWKDPEFSARVREKMAKKSDRQRSVASERMKRMNQTSEFREHHRISSENRKGKPFSGIRGGNGTLSRQQILLTDLIGYVTEFHVPTGDPSWRSLACDLANPELKIAVELDGSSHQTKIQKERDSRKDQKFRELGWIVLRFPNSEVDNNLGSVIRAVRLAQESRLNPSN